MRPNRCLLWCFQLDSKFRQTPIASFKDPA